MSLLSTIISIACLAGVYGIVPADYDKAVIIGTAGAVTPYIVLKLLLFFKLKKPADFISWFVPYVVLCVYAYITGHTEILVFSTGAVLNIIICAVTGGKIVSLIPFRELRFKAVIIPYISVALLLSSIIFACLVNIPTLPVWSTMVIGVLLFILTVLNMEFFKRLRNVISYLLKIDTDELKKTCRESTIKVLLKEISPLWTRNKAVISLQSLANGTWLADEPKKETVVWEFGNDDISFFWETDINKIIYREEFKNAAGEILSFLDNYGNCPSVVKEQSKSYGKYGYADEKTTFDILYGQTLIEHTLGVCRLIMKDTKVFQGINLEKMILTALGHDIGKAASFSNIDGYKTGDHPNTSIMLIETRFNYFEKLNYADEVMKMIKNHHGTPSASTPLLQEFKDYDSKARREYLKEYFRNKEAEEQAAIQTATPASSDASNTVQDNTVNKPTEHVMELPPTEPMDISGHEPENNENKEANTGFMPSFVISEDIASNKISDDDSVPSEAVKPAVVAVENDSKIDINTADKHVANENNRPLKKISANNDTLYSDLSNSEIPDSYVISTFFDIEDFLRIVSRSINIIDRGKFNYFTVNGDLVLCYTAAVIFEVKKSARLKKVSDIANLKENEIGMSFTEYCRKLGVLHTDWIQEGYYQGNFALTDMDGNVVKTGRYIPLRADAFSEYGSYTDFEERKKGELANIINARVATKDEMYSR